MARAIRQRCEKPFNWCFRYTVRVLLLWRLNASQFPKPTNDIKCTTYDIQQTAIAVIHCSTQWGFLALPLLWNTKEKLKKVCYGKS